jgi:preprotein translocase subunit SecD
VYQNPVWQVDITFTGDGASAWDTFAHKYFHELVGFDLDGQAVSVPVIQPSNTAFSSFGGRTDLTGNFTRQTAEEIAADLDSGPLATPLSL